ncbi:hypothetical protein HanRHA438_Chr06g0260891 [Helianthus annuus]|nr:hypothetical protein HanRHA438_Chr06g0260891 [Helianthus annuus]
MKDNPSRGATALTWAILHCATWQTRGEARLVTHQGYHRLLGSRGPRRMSSWASRGATDWSTSPINSGIKLHLFVVHSTIFSLNFYIVKILLGHNTP